MKQQKKDIDLGEGNSLNQQGKIMSYWAKAWKALPEEEHRMWAEKFQTKLKEWEAKYGPVSEWKKQRKVERAAKRRRKQKNCQHNKNEGGTPQRCPNLVEKWATYGQHGPNLAPKMQPR